MKKIILSFMLSAITCSYSFAQLDTSKIEQYCEVVVTGRILSTKVNIDVNYGEQRKLFANYKVRDEQGKAVKFNSIVDALNYLGQNGWKLVNAFLVPDGTNSPSYHYFLRKEFLKSDMDGAAAQ